MSIFSTGKGAANRAAANATAARQGRASNLTTFIDTIFNSPQRERQTTDFMGALRSQLGDATNLDYGNTARSTKFATARQGQTGGSIDVSRQQDNLQDLFKRRIGNEAQVQDAGNDLRTQDLGTRESLINGAYGTADVGQDALRGMIGQQSKNSQYLGTLLPSLAGTIGKDVAGGYSNRAQMDAFRRGLQPGGY